MFALLAGSELANIFHGVIVMAKKPSKYTKFKVGRDAGTGEFIPVKEAERRKKTAIVETIKRPRKP